MLEQLKEVLAELEEKENRAYNRMNRKRELGNPEEALRQEGKWIAYRTAREMVEWILTDYEEDEEVDEWAKYDEPHNPFDEVGYNPYTGGYDADL